jgi:hypothetical protein
MKRLLLFLQLSIIAVSVSAVQTITNTQAAAFTSTSDITEPAIQLTGTWATSNFTGLIKATKGNTNLVTVDMSQISLTADQTLALTSMFEGCTNLESVIWFSAQATEATEGHPRAHSLGNAFKGCSKLKGTIDLSAFPQFGSCSYAFDGCTSLDAVIFSQTATVPSSYSAMFDNTNSKLEVFVPVDAAWDALICQTNNNEPKYFRGNIRIIPNTQGPNFTSPADITESEIQLLNNTNGWTSNQFIALSNATKGNTDLVKVDMSQVTPYQQTLNLASIFEGCTNLERVIWFSAQAIAGDNSHTLSRAFYGCSKLEGTVDLSAFPQFGSFARAFEGCTSLDAVIFSNTAGYPSTGNGAAYTFDSVNPDIKIYIPAAESWTPLVDAYPDLTFIGTIDEENATIDSNVTISKLIINEGKSLTIAPNRQLTIRNTIQNDGTLILKSDATGTATVLMPAEADDVTASVEQYLSTESGARKWYYLASPVTGAATDLFGEGVKIGSYDEEQGDYTNPLPLGEETTLTAGRGYVVKLAASEDITCTFSGTLNNGDVSVPVTRTAGKGDGFNLVGNPYPSYINWDDVYQNNENNIESTIWTRTFEGSNMLFKTYNADSQTGTDDETTAHIAPLQAFWVRVPDGTSESTLVFSNTSRMHKGDGDANLRVAEARPLLRLRVSNGTSGDNTVILFDDRATESFDTYDSEKRSNNNAAIPEIYTLAGTEIVAINTLPGAAEGRELPLGFHTQTAGTFNISIDKIENIEQVTLIDNQKEFDLTAGNYEFYSDIADTADRFTLAFRAPQTPTAWQNANRNPDLSVYADHNRIRIVTAAAGTVSVYNVAGQKLAEQTSTGGSATIGNAWRAGVYFVKINNETRKIIVK